MTKKKKKKKGRECGPGNGSGPICFYQCVELREECVLLFWHLVAAHQVAWTPVTPAAPHFGLRMSTRHTAIHQFLSCSASVLPAGAAGFNSVLSRDPRDPTEERRGKT
jgi:hypothetical protein